jgi:hypothetical protein
MVRAIIPTVTRRIARRTMTLPRALRAAIPTLLLSLTAPACFPGLFSPVGPNSPSYQAAMKDAQKQSDDAHVARLNEARQKVKASPGAADDARVLAQQVLTVHQLGVVERAGLDSAALVKEATDALDAADTTKPETKAEVLFSKGALLLGVKKTDEGVAALRESMAAKASPRACVLLIGELDKQGDPNKEIIPLCKKAIPNAASDETRYAVLDSCLKHSHGTSVDEGLKWAGNDQIAFYKEYTRKIEEENAAHRREQEERSAQMRAEMDESRRRDDERRQEQRQSSSPSPSGPSRWSLTLHNDCRNTVKLFLGQKPKWGSGTYTSLGGNNTTSYSGNAGDMIWIVDDSQNGVSSLSPSGNQRMKITASCSGFAPD